MCGISGLVNLGDHETLARMTAIQRHRGPDDSGLWERRFPDGGYFALGSRRLAILDLSSAGHMPMCNEARTLWITYNGEIYNFKELRAELEAKGHRVHSHTDTEVLLHLYEHEGPECVRRLNGMFAFAICDLRSNSPELFLARDHFGVKPIYYAQRREGLAFASELKALLTVSEIKPELDFDSLHQYLTFLWIPEPRTMFRDIHKLPAGHHAIFRNGELCVTKYWDLEFPPANATYTASEEELTEEVRQRFQQAVASQMVSDVPVGAFLSAGLDSSSIVTSMTQATQKPVRTYTITFPQKYRIGENTLDDPQVPTRLCRRLGCENQQIVVEPDVADLLPRIAWHMDDPTADPAIIAAYLVCREASKSSTVLLSGVGGDELFAGYRKHVAHYWGEAYRKIPAPLRRLISSVISNSGSFHGSQLKGIVRLAKKMTRSAALPQRERFVTNCMYMDAEHKASFYSHELLQEIGNSDPSLRHWETFTRVQNADFLNQMLYLDSKIFMPSLNLNYNDKMSMASSVEVRVPFLDRKLAEFAAQRIPPWLKLKGRILPTTKYIFRKAMKDVLPSEVLNQPKAGFAVPVDYWLAHDLRDMVDDLLSPSRIRNRGLFRPTAVRKFVDEHRQGRHDWSMQIWQFLTLEIWMQTFVDRAVQPVSAGSSVSEKLAG